MAKQVAEAPLQEIRKTLAFGFRMEDRSGKLLLVPRVERLRHDVEVTAENRRLLRVQSLANMIQQRVQPCELALEVGMLQVLAVRHVNGGERDPSHFSREQPRPEVLLAGQSDLANGAQLAREDGDAVPRLLPVRQSMVARRFELGRPELLVEHLELLEADDIGLPVSQPAEDVLLAGAKAVHVPSGDPQLPITARSGPRGNDSVSMPVHPWTRAPVDSSDSDVDSPRLDRDPIDSPNRSGSEQPGREDAPRSLALQLTVSQRRLVAARDAASKTRWFCKPSWKSGRMGSPAASACSQS